jgi:feruloyl esterase
MSSRSAGDDQVSRSSFKSLLAAFLLGAVAQGAHALDCEALAAAKIPGGRIVSATHMAAPFAVPASMSATSISQLAEKVSAPMAEQMTHGTVRVPFCRVIGVLTPTPSSEINFEAWLPEERYNGRLVQEGDGGLLGAIPYTLMSKLINRGFAVTGSDKGHKSESMEWQWAINQPEKVIDHHYRATHVTTVAAKALVRQLYGAPASHTYFSGCSGGAVQGYEAAMHSPDDFDGIAIGGAAPPVSGLPGIGQLPAIIAQSQGLGAEKLRMIAQAATAACDEDDGVKDGIISYPKQCKFDPHTLACRNGSGSDCLSELEVAAVKRGYAFGMSPGTEYYWRFLENLGAMFPPEAYKYLLVPAPEQETHLQSFAAKGHKMIAYIGTVDVGAPGFEKYQEVLVAGVQNSASQPAGAEQQIGRFYRAFELPGMEHCMGGPGPNNISASLQPERLTAVASNQDIMSALVDWVEHNKAPEFLVATKYVDDDPAKPVAMTRPVCVFPKLAQWDRKGDPSSYKSFSCVNPPAH